MKGTESPEKCRLGLILGIPILLLRYLRLKKKKKKAFVVFKILLYQQQKLSLAAFIYFNPLKNLDFLTGRSGEVDPGLLVRNKPKVIPGNDVMRTLLR